jgi:type II secretory pathway component HofQ
MRLRAVASALLILLSLAAPVAAAGRPPASSAVSLDFVHADLVYVLKVLAKSMHKNLVTDSSVKGTVTMDLRNVPADRAFKLVLAINNLECKSVGNILVVGSPETLSRIQP